MNPNYILILASFLLLTACSCIPNQVLESPQINAAPLKVWFWEKSEVDVTPYEKIVFL